MALNQPIEPKQLLTLVSMTNFGRCQSLYKVDLSLMSKYPTKQSVCSEMTNNNTQAAL
ncbi:Uncharacterised protein [Vibrio cholerae]|nr:Uncharacterised protein [Vibrio cholerae]CSI48245.1 Uncharacterised protein [Vibrio cholerae]